MYDPNFTFSFTICFTDSQIVLLNWRNEGSDFYVTGRNRTNLQGSRQVIRNSALAMELSLETCIYSRIWIVCIIWEPTPIHLQGEAESICEPWFLRMGSTHAILFFWHLWIVFESSVVNANHYENDEWSKFNAVDGKNFHNFENCNPDNPYQPKCLQATSSDSSHLDKYLHLWFFNTIFDFVENAPDNFGRLSK